MMCFLEESDGGDIQSRNNLRTVYVPQQDIFDEGLSVAEVLERPLIDAGHGEFEIEGKVRSALGRVVFPDPQAPVSKLSGGWRKRLAIVRGLTQEPELLLLDEPTNDLDISTLEVLEESFNEYPGAIVLVTHDRYLLERTANVILGIAPNGGVLFGDYLQWEDWHRDQGQPASITCVEGSKKPNSKSKKEISGLEAQLAKAEKQLVQLEEEVG
jgi:ATP-binding cassette subfamily F protein uup